MRNILLAWLSGDLQAQAKDQRRERRHRRRAACRARRQLDRRPSELRRRLAHRPQRLQTPGPPGRPAPRPRTVDVCAALAGLGFGAVLAAVVSGEPVRSPAAAGGLVTAGGRLAGFAGADLPPPVAAPAPP